MSDIKFERYRLVLHHEFVDGEEIHEIEKPIVNQYCVDGRYGGSLIIVDDPYKGLETEFTPTQIRKRWDWYTSLIEQRLRTKSKLVLLHTRWHSEDIQGKIKDDEYQSSKYEFVEYQAIDKNS